MIRPPLFCGAMRALARSYPQYQAPIAPGSPRLDPPGSWLRFLEKAPGNMPVDARPRARAFFESHCTPFLISRRGRSARGFRPRLSMNRKVDVFRYARDEGPGKYPFYLRPGRSGRTLDDHNRPAGLGLRLHVLPGRRRRGIVPYPDRGRKSDRGFLEGRGPGNRPMPSRKSTSSSSTSQGGGPG